MGRRRKGKAVEVKVLVPEAIYLRLERALTSNFSHKPEYGTRSQLITSLIVNWLNEREQYTPPVPTLEKETTDG